MKDSLLDACHRVELAQTLEKQRDFTRKQFSGLQRVGGIHPAALGCRAGTPNPNS